MAEAQMTLVQCELLTIRYLALVAEKLVHDLTTFKGIKPEYERLSQTAIKGLCDRIEHIAQYSLEGLAESTRATYLMRDIEAIIEVLNGFPSEIPNLVASPSSDDLSRLAKSVSDLTRHNASSTIEVNEHH